MNVETEKEFKIIEKNFKAMDTIEKRRIKRDFRDILVNGTLKLDILSINALGLSLNKLGNRSDWENMTKIRQASLLSFCDIDDKKYDTYFLKLLKHLFIYFKKSQALPRSRHWDIVYREEKCKLSGIRAFFIKLIKPGKKLEYNLYMKFDIVDSSELLKKYPKKFPTIQNRILEKIHEISAEFNTEIYATEGDAVYYFFDNAFKDYTSHCRNLVLFSIKVLHWIKYYNFYENPINDDVNLRIVGINVATVIENPREKAKLRLSGLEKNRTEPGQIALDHFIVSKIPTIISRYFDTTIISDGKLSYYEIKLEMIKSAAAAG